MLSALDYAHNVRIQGQGETEIHGILHRDIKPENIMITPGSLSSSWISELQKPLNINSNTMQGMIVGTFHYMSPEQLAGTTLDARSDFFSMGIVLYEMATGQRPFAAENLTELIDKIKSCKYTRIRSIRPSISPLTEELIDKLLTREQSHRPATAKEINDMLQHCIHSFNTWGTSKKVIVPFSIRRHFPTISLIIAVIACFLSGISLHKSIKAELPAPRFTESASTPLLEQGRISERKEQWTAAINSYNMVPPIEKGDWQTNILRPE